MSILFSVILAYFLIGISNVLKDLNTRAIDAPMWTHNPSLKMVALSIVLWPLAQFTRYTGQPLARSIAFGLLGICSQWVLLSAFVYGCIFAATNLFDNSFVQIIAAAIFMALGSFIALPVMSLFMIPIMLVFGIVLEVIFPMKK